MLNTGEAKPLRFKVDDKSYTVDLNEFTGSEARLFRHAVGCSFVQALYEGHVDPLEMLAGFKWLLDRRDDPKVEFDSVLDKMTYNSIEMIEDKEDDASPPASGAPSAPTSPPSPTSLVSSPGR